MQNQISASAQERFLTPFSHSAVGPGNQLLEDADFTYTYDAEGNRATRTRTSSDTSLDALTEFTYDFRQRLVKVTIYHADADHKTVEVAYAYDTLDRKVSRTETRYQSDGTTVASQSRETYVFDEGATRAGIVPGAASGANGALGSGEVLFDFFDADTSDSTPPVLYRRYLAALDRVFAQENLFVDDSVSNSSNPNGAPVGTYWLIQDRLGTVRNVIDNNRVIWNHAQYDAFGNRVSLDYPHTNPATPLDRSLTRFGFTGQEYDEVTGLTWYSNGDGNGNWYDPKTNTWIKRDALPVRSLNPNAYVYAANSPTNFVDPNGQDVDKWLESISPEIRWALSDEQREALRFGYYAALLKLERDALLARARYLKEQISRFEAIRGLPICPGSRGGNMLAGMKNELAEIESRFAENIRQSTELEEYFSETGLDQVEFQFRLPSEDDYRLHDYGKGLAGAQWTASAILNGWSGRSGGLQPSWDPIEAFAALRGAWGLARGAISLGRSAVAFGKNVRDLSRFLSRSADDFLKELDEVRNAPPPKLPCGKWRQSIPDSKVLGRNLGIQRGSGMDAHHIVPGAHSRAAPSRAILDRYQIDINAAENGVPLIGGRGAPQATFPRHHRGSGLHSQKGIDAVNSRLSDATRGIDDWATARQRVIDELSEIRAEILAGTFP
ncbi:MAG: AHH domain-containing protein [Pirellulales bacterium]|nr:AHH domain-containing protein [Pirellulales bacterium]